MVDNGTIDTVTEMAPSILEEKEDDKKTTIESEPVPSKSQQGEKKTKSTDDKKLKNVNKTVPSTASKEGTYTESSKQKKKKKKDTPTAEQKTNDTSNSSSAKVNTGTEDGKENGTVNKEKEKTEKEDNQEKKSVGNKEKKVRSDPSSGPVVSASKKTRPQYKYDPEKITLRFLFANKDGLTVTVECKPGDTVGEVKGQLLSVWPENLDNCSGGDHLRLICMGKGVLMPDTRTLQDCEVPVFKTHPTPINVAVRPKANAVETSKSGRDGGARGGSSSGGGASSRTTEETGQGCGCVIS